MASITISGSGSSVREANRDFKQNLEQLASKCNPLPPAQKTEYTCTGHITATSNHSFKEAKDAFRGAPVTNYLRRETYELADVESQRRVPTAGVEQKPYSRFL